MSLFYIGNKDFRYKVGLGRWSNKLNTQMWSMKKWFSPSKHPAQAWIQEKTKCKERKKVRRSQDAIQSVWSLHGKKILKPSTVVLQKKTKSTWWALESKSLIVLLFVGLSITYWNKHFWASLRFRLGTNWSVACGLQVLKS